MVPNHLPPHELSNLNSQGQLPYRRKSGRIVGDVLNAKNEALHERLEKTVQTLSGLARHGELDNGAGTLKTED